MSTSSVPVRHHLVSKGYQKNFADAKQRLSILSARDGKTVELLRPAKRNWAKNNWNSFTDSAGVANPHLELEFSKIEASVMRSIREVTVRGPTSLQKGAIINLFAMHLARSRTFVDFRYDIYNSALPGIISELTQDQQLAHHLEAELGREPMNGELDEFILRHAKESLLTKQAGLRSVAEIHNQFADKLNDFDIQIVEVADHLPRVRTGGRAGRPCRPRVSSLRIS